MTILRQPVFVASQLILLLIKKMSFHDECVAVFLEYGRIKTVKDYVVAWNVLWKILINVFSVKKPYKNNATINMIYSYTIITYFNPEI